ncbi:unnamed protein product [Clonostachys solani]|uniref:Uncharacterized protein n=1 Tax=Clonostachys solani TaxID=160281 RepID=A0A9N9ZEN9_9HYPO|nr:unnamed protein product [Clonostachys solani]
MAKPKDEDYEYHQRTPFDPKENEIGTIWWRGSTGPGHIVVNGKSLSSDFTSDGSQKLGKNDKVLVFEMKVAMSYEPEGT